MTLIFFLGVGLYFFLMVLVGYLCRHKCNTFEEYLVAGRNLPLYIAIPTVIATWFGAGTSMGVAGTVYEKGFYGVIPDPFGYTLALIIAGLFFAAPFRRLRLLTLSDLLRKVYGREFELAATLVVLPFYVGILASQMLAMGNIFTIVSGIPLEVGVFIGSLIVVFYTVIGGMWAVTLTGLIQFVLMTSGLLIVLPICLEQVPDRQAVFDKFIFEFSNLVPRSDASWLSYAGRILLTSLGVIMGQNLIQRILACRSEQVARNSCLLGALCYFFLGLIPLYIGIAGREIYPNLDNPELLVPLLAKEYLSPLLFTLFACGLLSAIMSTADSYLLAGTTLLTNNIILKAKPMTCEKTKIALLRWVSVALAVVAFSLSLSGHSIFDMIVHSGATLFVGVFVPATAALLWKGATPVAAWSSLVGGIVGWLGYIFVNLSFYSDGHEDLLFAAAAFGGISSLVIYVVVSVVKANWRSTTMAPTAT